MTRKTSNCSLLCTYLVVVSRPSPGLVSTRARPMNMSSDKIMEISLLEELGYSNLLMLVLLLTIRS